MKAEPDKVLKLDAALAEFTVAVNILAENEVAALAELADAEANAPAADAEFVNILSVWVLLVVEILADKAVWEAKLAENDVAADAELADAVWNAPQADADTVDILSVWVLLVVEILADNAVWEAKLAENEVAADAEFAVYPATLALIRVSNEPEAV